MIVEISLESDFLGDFSDKTKLEVGIVNRYNYEIHMH